MFGIVERLKALEDGNRRIEALLIHLLKNLNIMSGQFSQQVQDLQAAVANEQTVENSAIVLLQGLAAQLKQALQGAATSGDLTQVEQLANQINSNATALAAAVTANTPAATPHS